MLTPKKAKNCIQVQYPYSTISFVNLFKNKTFDEVSNHIKLSKLLATCVITIPSVILSKENSKRET